MTDATGLDGHGLVADASIVKDCYVKGEYRRAADLSSLLLSREDVDSEQLYPLRSLRCLSLQKLGDVSGAINDALFIAMQRPEVAASWDLLGGCLLSARLPQEAQSAYELATKLAPGKIEHKSSFQKAKHAARAKAQTRRAPSENDKQMQFAVREVIKCGKQNIVRKEIHQGDEDPMNVQGGDIMADAVRPTFTPPATPLVTPSSGICRTSSTSGSIATADDTEGQPMDCEDLPSTSDEPDKSRLADQQKELGNKCYRAKDWQGACNAYGAAIELTPGSAVLWANRAAVQLMLGKFKSALEDSQRAIKLEPDLARGHQRAGKAHLTMGHTSQAKACYETALKLEASAASKEGLQTALSVETHLTQGTRALESGDARMALWHSESALRESVPAVESAQLLKIRALSSLGRHSEALGECRSLTIEGSSSSPEVLAARAAALYSSGNMQLAERVYQEALRMDPDSGPCRRGIKRVRGMSGAKEAGNQAFKLGRWQEALEHYTAAVQQDPGLRSSFVAQCYCNRAAAASKLGRHSQALEDAEEAVSCDPDFAKAYLRRAAANSALKHYEAAVRDYDKVKGMAPETPGIGKMVQDAKLELKKAKRVDLYKVLDVPPAASQDQLKRAYKKMALKLHPDKAVETDRVQAEMKFKQLTAAHSILSDPEKRQKFDAGWTEEEIEQGGREGGGFGGNSADINELYEQLFGMRGSHAGFGQGFGGTGGFHSNFGGMPRHSHFGNF